MFAACSPLLGRMLPGLMLPALAAAWIVTFLDLLDLALEFFPLPAWQAHEIVHQSMPTHATGERTAAKTKTTAKHTAESRALLTTKKSA